MNSIQEKTKFKVMKILNKVKKLKLTQLKKAGNNQMNRRKARIKEGKTAERKAATKNIRAMLCQKAI